MNVFDFAIEVERKGRNFYREMADKTSVAGVRSIFSMMASDEQVLINRLRAMKGAAQTAVIEDSGVLEYLGNAFFRVFDEAEALRVSSDLEAYNYVMKVERDICHLYEEAAGRESRAEVQALLRRIASEERRELESIEKIYEFVNAPNEFLAWGEFSNLAEYHNFGRDEG
jgi:rubrerythrin